METFINEDNECTMNTCAEQSPVYTTNDIKNKEYLCKEWIQKWRFDDAVLNMNELRNKVHELEQENRELKRAIKTIARILNV